ncbi:IgGFc-binding protein-like [Alligator mississippiensis]|uniref:IgGFc-binding protein-like n=1 Tax=Alligator mississippiensis TaxID=8496 RepID=UPI0003D0FACE|nr:IgGFc-binding protein-like [Alligator mississippiensis]
MDGLRRALALAALLYPSGVELGDRRTPLADDGASPPVPLSVPFHFYRRTYHTLYVNNNGLVSFGAPETQYTSDPFPLPDGRALVAPFWADVDVRVAGRVLYRQSRAPGILARATADVGAAFPHLPFTAAWVFVATWDRVAFYGATVAKVSTFQVMLVSDGRLSFIILNYGDIQWTTGAGSGGDPRSGLGGIPAQAGFNSGGSRLYFSLPGSRTPAIAHVGATSNVGLPGRWLFRVDDFSLPHGCVYNAQFLPPGAALWTDEDCRQHCQCLAGDGGLTCEVRRCGPGEACRPAAGYHACQPASRAACQALGGSCYRTLDGHSYRTQGTCAHVLSQAPTAPSSGLAPYRVEAGPGARGGVRVAAHKQEVTVASGATGHVMVNGIRTLLPVILLNGKIQVHQSGFYVRITTDFGLVVSYDGRHHVEVMVPPAYFNTTCGLCGTLTNDPDDDFWMPNSTLVTSPVAFTTSWQVIEEGRPCAGDVELPACPDAQRARYTSNDSCGFMEMSPGPFAACAQVLPPVAFVESCVENLCVVPDADPEALCRALGSYMESCQAANITVGQWRTDSFCGITCHENSHYEECASACPASCSDSTAPLYCTQPCREGCICNPGYILSGASCVPLSQCGCLLDGRYHALGSDLILTDTCSRKCSCREPAQPMQCQPHTCRALETCSILDGVRGCHPIRFGLLQVFGRLHYTTFDRATFDVPGTCTYTLSTYCGPPGQLPSFTIRVESKHWGSISMSSTRRVEVEVYGHHIIVDAEKDGQIQVNGTMANLPMALASGKLSAYYSGSSVIVQAAFGLSMSYDGSHDVTVAIPETYAGLLCGLGGDFNANRSDDFRTPDGSAAPGLASFVTSWKAPGSPFHCEAIAPERECSNGEGARYIALNSCGIITDMAGPFSACGSQEDAHGFLHSCVHDLCATEGSRQTLCQVLQSYAQQCQRQGFPIQAWREQAGCELLCPLHSHYELCGPSCPASCASPTGPQSCLMPCVEGCQCDRGLVLSGTACVSLELCGCTHNGRYYLPGEEFWEDEQCQQLCQCQGLSHTVQCSSATCAPGEICSTWEGVLGCHLPPPSTCWAAGLPHYHTFDGRLYDLWGTCAYIFAEVCGISPVAPYFRVDVRHEHQPQDPMAGLSEVSVLLSEVRIRLQRGQPNTVEVNGITEILPLRLQREGIIVYQAGSRTVVQTDFNLTLNADLAHGLVLTLPHDFRGHTCGLCGNFNGAPDDDFLLRDGSQVPDAFHFAADWKAEPVPSCTDGCPKPCPGCAQGAGLVAAKSQCWMLQDPNGPFSTCHSQLAPGPYFSTCIFDVCMSGGDMRVLCLSIQTYATACQQAEVKISNWRNESFCALQCPAHSHYRLCGRSYEGMCGSTWLGMSRGQTCSEGCFCDDGYLRSGDRCVLPEECGCERDGHYYNVGDHIWLSGCTQRCSCDSRNTLRCSHAQCSPGQQCAVRHSRLGCQRHLSTCVVTGDPHYFTFDGAVAHFQGACDYEVAHTCNSSAAVSFRVVMANRHFRSPRVSFVYRVEVWLRSHQLNAHVVLERGKAVHVNGTRMRLPAQLGPSAEIVRLKNLLVVRAGGSLEVQFNGASSAFVRVGPEHRRGLCGMCGNFDGDPTDDKVLPDGTPAHDDAQFGNAWVSDRSPPGCTNGTGELRPCLALPEVRRLCGILTNRSGPFAECHWHELPGPYLESCVYDLCQYGTGNRMLCAALESYAEMCALLGVRVPSWRRALGCGFLCPANQYFDFCGPACPASCADPGAPARCRKPCVAGCFCREGYALEAGVCVPQRQCGCLLDGHYHVLGTELILTDTCSRKCICREPAQPMQCQPHACRALETCRILDGVRGCHPMQFGLLRVFGHLHYITFDGATYDTPGACTYTLSTYCGPPGQLPGFTVRVESQHWGSIAMSRVRRVEVEVYGHRVAISVGQDSRVQVNGSLANLPLVLAAGKVHAYFSSSSTMVQTDFGLSVSYDWSHDVTMSIPEAYARALCGLGGDFDGDPSNDFRTPTGTLVHDAATFRDSWKEPGSPFHCLAVGVPTLCSEAELAQYGSPNACGMLVDANGPFHTCGMPASVQSLAESCVKDMCAKQGSRQALCEALSSYARQCQRHGLPIQPWRHKAGCELLCPPHSHYKLCGPSCPASCASPVEPQPCPTPCAEGCQCDAGLVLSGTTCVSPEQCGCTHNGRYYLPGEQFWEGERCQQRCQCQGSSHMVQCSNATCASGEICSMHEGFLGCHVPPPGICWAAGLPHYYTFDGRLYDLHGTCSYIFAEACGVSPAAPYFRVDVRHKHQPQDPVAGLSEVSVLVNGVHIHLWRGQPGTVEVDGVAQPLPLHLPAAGVKVHANGLLVALSTGFGLQLRSDLAHGLELILPPAFRSHTCGLCGNFNGTPDDDDLLPDDSQAPDASSLAAGWKVASVPGCTDGCLEVCPGCAQDARLVAAKSQCWVLQDPDGPFSMCHAQLDPSPYMLACVFDVCVSGGDTRVLCPSIQTYASACQRANASISPWRNNSFCGK